MEMPPVRKSFMVALMLTLFFPASGFAAGATSRWDVTIGGFVKADFGWADQGQGADYTYASRYGYVNPPAAVINENLYDRYGSLYMAAGETRVSLAVKGPDAWAATTSAFVEGEFTGATGATDTYGLFRLRHAFMRMDWTRWSLLIGQTWDDWGVILPDLLGRIEASPTRKGTRAPQIRLTNRINADWNWYVMLYQPNADQQGTWNLSGDDFSRSNIPQMAAELTWLTDRCGRVGKDRLFLAVSGMTGREKLTYADPASPGRWADDGVNAWAAAFKGFIPLIPERAGDKSMSLFLKGQFLYGQNWRVFNTANADAAAYNQDLSAGASYVAPTAFAWYAQLGFYFTDRLWANIYYADMKNNLSYRYQWSSGTSGTIRTFRQWSLNVIFDVNPAVRTGLQFSHIDTGYAGYGTSNSDPCTTTGVLGRSGALNTARFAAWYFF
jgi:hypothetical protein